MHLPDTPQDTDNRIHQGEIDEARALLNSEGYVVVKWNPGDTWIAGEIREIDEDGLAIQLTHSEVRSAANQLNSIWADHAHAEDMDDAERDCREREMQQLDQDGQL